MPPQFIVLHHTGRWPAVRYLTTDMSSDVSSHRYIEPYYSIMKLVDDDLIAYTQGFADVGPWSDKFAKNFNAVSLSIEMAYDPMRDTAWSPQVVWLAACQCCEWWGKYGLLPIVYHSQIDIRKDDPLRFPRTIFDGYLIQLTTRAMTNRLPNWEPDFATPWLNRP
jgi:N-acetyl-anhydromuramyl-L-alanine amidase AmpD